MSTMTIPKFAKIAGVSRQAIWYAIRRDEESSRSLFLWTILIVPLISSSTIELCPLGNSTQLKQEITA